MSVWDNFSDGLELGDDIGRGIRDRRAFQEGGLPAVEQEAGRTGDLQQMENVRGMQRRQRTFENDQTRQAYENFERVAPRARNIIRATRNMDPQRAGAFLQQNRRFFEDAGFSPEQVDAGIAGLTSANPAERQQWAEQLDAAFGQYQDPNWRIMNVETGQIGAIDQQGQYIEGGRAPAGVGREWRAATAEELQAAGAPPGTIMDVNITTGERRVRRNPPAGRASQGAGYPDAESTLRELGGEWLD